ncbi:MAG TPA: hydroxysqualene dehydroxylase HpnE [Caulobacteraceae bacterium]
MTTGTVHVVGAGLAGLSAATILAERGVRVVVHEAAAQAGGRCRSYFDPQLGMTIDNGNHLVLSGNRAVQAYLKRLGASDRLAGPEKAEFAFFDLGDGTRWVMRPSDGRIPWWVFQRSRRVPGTRAADYAVLAKFMSRHPGKRMDEVIRTAGPLWRRMLQPVMLAVLNTAPDEGSMDLAGAVVRESLALGGMASRPRIAAPTLAAAFVEPAVTYLQSKGVDLRLRRSLKAIETGEGRAKALQFTGETVELGADDRVILAVAPAPARDLLAGLPVPDDFRAIVNGHFALPDGFDWKAHAPMTGLIGGTAEWVFVFHDRISVTVSGADRLVDDDREALARRLWADVARTLDLGEAPLPAWQIVKEKRATFAATPAVDAIRPHARAAGLSNLVIAGDWTQTGLPATIEGALRSGETAAGLVS